MFKMQPLASCQAITPFHCSGCNSNSSQSLWAPSPSFCCLPLPHQKPGSVGRQNTAEPGELKVTRGLSRHVGQRWEGPHGAAVWGRGHQCSMWDLLLTLEWPSGLWPPPVQPTGHLTPSCLEVEQPCCRYYWYAFLGENRDLVVTLKHGICLAIGD